MNPDIDKQARKSLQERRATLPATPVAPPTLERLLGTESDPSCTIYSRGSGYVAGPTIRPGISFLERDEQRSFVSWLRAHNIRHHSIPNSAARSREQTADLKREGLSKGAPDLYVFLPGRATLAIEMKRECGILSDVGEEQWDWHEFLPGCPGWYSCIAFGKRAAVEFVLSVIRHVDTGRKIET